MYKHENSGRCLHCLEIINKYPGFDQMLKDWFVGFQEKHPECHVSEAGRGHVDQESDFLRGASKAHFGESAHNFNAALDLFVLQDQKAVWPKDWFNRVLSPNLPGWIEWYGAPGAKFFELPHIQKRNWRMLVAAGSLKIVEPLLIA